MGLKNSDLEPCLFIWREGDKFLILLLYVDDILLSSNDEEKLNEVKTKLSIEFEMTILGEPKEFLSISIRRDRENKVIDLTQEKYIGKILVRFGFDLSGVDHLDVVERLRPPWVSGPIGPPTSTPRYRGESGGSFEPLLRRFRVGGVRGPGAAD